MNASLLIPQLDTEKKPLLWWRCAVEQLAFGGQTINIR